MSGRRSRTKGHAFEREIARHFRDAGFPEAKRGFQTRDGREQPDVTLDGCWIECKRLKVVQWGDVLGALDQGELAEDNRGRYVVAIIKRDRQGEPTVCMSLETFTELYREARGRWDD